MYMYIYTDICVYICIFNPSFLLPRLLESRATKNE